MSRVQQETETRKHERGFDMNAYGKTEKVIDDTLEEYGVSLPFGVKRELRDNIVNGLFDHWTSVSTVLKKFNESMAEAIKNGDVTE